MSNRKNNTKSKKTTNNSSDFNSFRMEALEPRLLQQVANLSARQCQKASFLSLRSPCMVVMSATAAEWQAELDPAVNTMDSQVESIVSAHTDSFSEDLDGLYMTDSNTGVTRLATLSDLAKAPDNIKNLNWNSFVSAVSDDMDDKIDDLVAATVVKREILALTAENAYAGLTVAQPTSNESAAAAAWRVSHGIAASATLTSEQLGLAHMEATVARTNADAASADPGSLVFSASEIADAVGENNSITIGVQIITYSAAA